MGWWKPVRGREAGPGAGRGNHTNPLIPVPGSMPADPAERLAEALLDRSETVAVAESCTGGLVGAELTAIEGASDWFEGGAIAYTPEAKVALLGVDGEALEEHGAVSEVVARQMAEGALVETGADWAVSTTGYAGPEGGPEAPVGTVYVGIAAAGADASVERHRIQGARNAVRRRMAGDAMADAVDVVEGS